MADQIHVAIYAPSQERSLEEVRMSLSTLVQDFEAAAGAWKKKSIFGP